MDWEIHPSNPMARPTVHKKIRCVLTRTMVIGYEPHTHEGLLYFRRASILSVEADLAATVVNLLVAEPDGGTARLRLVASGCTEAARWAAALSHSVQCQSPAARLDALAEAPPQQATTVSARSSEGTPTNDSAGTLPPHQWSAIGALTQDITAESVNSSVQTADNTPSRRIGEVTSFLEDDVDPGVTVVRCSAQPQTAASVPLQGTKQCTRRVVVLPPPPPPEELVDLAYLRTMAAPERPAKVDVGTHSSATCVTLPSAKGVETLDEATASSSWRSAYNTKAWATHRSPSLESAPVRRGTPPPVHWRDPVRVPYRSPRYRSRDDLFSLRDPASLSYAPIAATTITPPHHRSQLSPSPSVPTLNIWRHRQRSSPDAAGNCFERSQGSSNRRRTPCGRRDHRRSRDRGAPNGGDPPFHQLVASSPCASLTLFQPHEFLDCRHGSRTRVLAALTLDRRHYILVPAATFLKAIRPRRLLTHQSPADAAGWLPTIGIRTLASAINFFHRQCSSIPTESLVRVSLGNEEPLLRNRPPTECDHRTVCFVSGSGGKRLRMLEALTKETAEWSVLEWNALLGSLFLPLGATHRGALKAIDAADQG